MRRISRRSPGVGNRIDGLFATYSFGNCAQKVAPARTVDESAANNNRASRCELRPPLSGELRRTVNAGRIRIVTLGIETSLLAIKHVVCRYCNQDSAR